MTNYTETRSNDGATLATYDVPAERLPLIEKRHGRMVKDAKRAEMPTPELVHLGTYMEGTGDGTAIEMVRCQIKAWLDRRTNGYEVRAILRRTEEGNLIEHVDCPERDAEPIPEKYRQTGMVDVCEHCNTRRNRKIALVVHNTITDEWAQLGGSCLAKAMGLGTYSSISSLLTFRGKAQKALRDPELVKPVEEAKYTGVSTLLILTYLASSMREKGWQGSGSRSPTFADGLSRYHIDKHQSQVDPPVSRPYRPIPEDRVTAGAALSWAANLSDEECDGRGGDMMHNLRTIAANCFVSTRDLGWAALLMREHQRTLQADDEAQFATVSANVAKPGDLFGAPVDGKGNALRLTQGNESWPALAVRVTSVREWTSPEGRRVKIVNMRTDDGHSLIWWCPAFAWRTAGMVEGREYFVNCLVRKHGTFRGTPQTTVTWVSVSGDASGERPQQAVGGPSDFRELEIVSDSERVLRAAEAAQKAAEQVAQTPAGVQAMRQAEAWPGARNGSERPTAPNPMAEIAAAARARREARKSG